MRYRREAVPAAAARATLPSCSRFVYDERNDIAQRCSWRRRMVEVVKSMLAKKIVLS